MNHDDSLTTILRGWRRLIVRVTVAATLLSAAVSLVLPSWYRATATILPPRERGSGFGLADLMSQLGGGGIEATRSAANRLLGRSAVVDVSLGVLKSRRSRGVVVDRHDLVAVYDVPSREHAIHVLGRRLRADTTPEGLIEVQVEDRSRERAAALANEFLAVFDEFNRSTSVEDARRTVRFIQERLDENQGRLDEAATKLRDFQVEFGAIEIGAQARATVQAIADLQAERTSREVQRRVLGEYATPNMLEAQRLDLEIREMDRVIEAMEGRAEAAPSGKKGGAANPSPEGLVPLRELPALAQRYAELEQDVLVQGKIRELLSAQLEEARIREARDETTITILDEAVPPLRRDRPRRTLIVLVSAVLAVGLAAALSLGAHALLDRAAAGGGTGAPPGDDLLVRLAGRLRSWGGPGSAT
jgi:uncharacterized protein involved in exopolysaccharide biosynthesis